MFWVLVLRCISFLKTARAGDRREVNKTAWGCQLNVSCFCLPKKSYKPQLWLYLIMTVTQDTSSFRSLTHKWERTRVAKSSSPITPTQGTAWLPFILVIYEGCGNYEVSIYEWGRPLIARLWIGCQYITYK